MPCFVLPGAAPEPGLGTVPWEDILSQDDVTDLAPWAKRYTLYQGNKRKVLSQHLLIWCAQVLCPLCSYSSCLAVGSSRTSAHVHTFHKPLHNWGFSTSSDSTWQGCLLFCTHLCLIPRWWPSPPRLYTCIIISRVLLLQVSIKQEKHLWCEMSLDLNWAKHWPHKDIKWRSYHYRCVLGYQHLPPPPHRLEDMSPCKNPFQISIVGLYQTSSLWQPAFYWRLLHLLELHQHLSQPLTLCSSQLFGTRLASQWGDSVPWELSQAAGFLEVPGTHHKDTSSCHWVLKQPFTQWTKQGERKQGSSGHQKGMVHQEVVRGEGGQGWRKD